MIDGRHIMDGNCPDDLDPYARDRDCPVCQALTAFEKGGKIDAPHFWPQNPYPKSIFSGEMDTYINAMPDEALRTACSGIVGGFFWQLASDSILKSIKNYLQELYEQETPEQMIIELLEDFQIRSK